MRPYVWIAVVLAWICPCREISAQFILTGKIVNAESKEPVSGALISTHEVRNTSASDETGHFELRLLSSGNYHVHFEAFGFEAHAQHFVISQPETDIGVIELRPSSIELKQVVVESEVMKSTYRQQSLDLNVMDKKQWMNGASMTLAQQLSSIPGIQSLQTAQGVSKPVIRGLSGTRILVSDLGLKQEGQQWGSDHGLEIDAFSAEQVEVIKGPATLIYGSDALGGVVRVHIPAAPAQGWIGNVSSQYRSNNQYFGSSAMVEGASGKWFVKTRWTYSQYGDMRVPADRFIYLNRVLPLHEGFLKNTAGRELHSQTTLGYAWSTGILKLTYSLFSQKNGLFTGIVGIPTVFNLADDGDHRNVDTPRQEVTHQKWVANWTQNFRSGWLQLDAGVQQNLRREIIRPHREGYAPLPTDAVAHRLQLTTAQVNAVWHSVFSGGWKIIPGMSVSFQSNDRSGWEFLLPDYRTYQAGMFVFAERVFSDRSVLNFGVRGDRAVQHGESFAVPVYAPGEQITGYDVRVSEVRRSYFNYSASAGWSYMWTDRLNIKANVARSFRIPNPAELLINGIHHGTYRHEQGDPALPGEVGYQFDLTLAAEGKKTQVKLTPFFNYFNQYIYLHPTGSFSTLPDGGQVYRYTSHDAVFTGAEVYADWHPMDALHLETTVESVYSYNLSTGLGLPFTPPVRVRWSAIYEHRLGRRTWSGWSAGVTWQLWSDQKNVDRNEAVTPGAYKADAFFGLSWKGKNGETTLRLATNNILDRYYLNHLSAFRVLRIPEQGRNFSVALFVPFDLKRNTN